MNKVTLIGNLGADVELKYTPSGRAVATMRVATNERWTDKQGDKHERTEWHRVVAWSKQAENCAKFLKKGRSVYIEGRIQTRHYDDKAGNKRYVTEIIANQVTFLSNGQKDTASKEGEASAEAASLPI